MTTLRVSKRQIGAAAPVRSRTERWKRVFSSLVKYLSLLILAFFMLLPLFWMISSSLKPKPKIFVYPPEWIPIPPLWENYIEAWTSYPFDIFAINSFKIAILAVLGQLLFCSMAGYGFARFDFPFKNVMFAILLAVMMIPGVVNIIPLFIIFKNIGLIDNHLALILPPAIANTFGTFLFRQFMMTIPQELEDAARIDGANAWSIYWRIMVPLCKPAFAVLATFTFIGMWNQFFEPLVFMQSVEKLTVTVGLAYFRGEAGTEWHLLMAASTLALIPTVIVFLFTQRYFIRGITLSGLKY